MKPVRSFLLGLCFTLCGLTSSAQYQNMFMQITDPGAPLGEVFETGHVGWTNFLAYNAGSTSAVTLGGGGGGNVGMAATKCFTVSMNQDRMAHYLKRKMYTGTNIQRVTLDFIRVDGTGPGYMHYKVVMENVYVTAIEEGDSGPIITMNISFTPSRFRYTYTPRDGSGGTANTPVSFGWDVVQNIAW